MARPLADARRTEEALTRVNDQSSFLRELLVGALDWPIDLRRPAVEDVAYEWTEADLRAAGLSRSVVAGRAYQFVLPGNPFGVFLLEFRDERPLVTGRGMTGVLRAMLQGLVERKRAAADPRLATFRRDHLLFICTHEYQTFRFAYFKAPGVGLKAAPLTSFGWSSVEPGATRTVCEYNLPALRWPDAAPEDSHAWVEKWSAAFDVERVTERFYSDYASIFELAEPLIRTTGATTPDELRLITQSLFNRLMFIRFLERKGWLEFPGQRGTAYLAAVAGAGGVGAASIYASRLRPLFFEGLARGVTGSSARYGKVPFLNGGLFEETALDAVIEDVPDFVVVSIIGEGGLFYRYNFTVEESTPLDVDVAVDPEMLGRVFEELVTGRHGSGSYYTPRPVVSYMCREVLKRYLADGTDASDDAITRLVDHGQIMGLTEGHAAAIEKLLAGVKVLDPACGSGAYLLGFLHELINVRRSLQSALLTRDAEHLYRQKLHIINSSLYGVDIDAFATEIAKLRLWLSLAIESDAPLPLPNLDFRIETGDSLGPFVPVEHGLFDRALRERAAQLVRLKDEYLVAHGDARDELRAVIVREEGSIAVELRRLVGAGVVDWHVQFADVMAEKGGFDIVLANPPYVSAMEHIRKHGREERERLKRLFRSTTGTWDLYVPFFERGIELLRPDGYLAYISPNKYLSASYAQSLRNYVREHASLWQVVDLSQVPVFASASVYPVLTFLKRSQNEELSVMCRQPSSAHEGGSVDPARFAIVLVPQSALDLLPERLWGFLLSDRLDMLVRLLPGTVPLRTVATALATTTAAEADRYGGAVRDDANGAGFRVVNTGTIDSFGSLWGKRRLKNGGQQFLHPRLDTKVPNERRRRLYSSPKILVAKLGGTCEAFLDADGSYCGLNINCVTEPVGATSLAFLCGYLNSELFMFFYGQLFGALRMSGGAYQFQAPQLRVVPVPVVSAGDQERIADLVHDLSRGLTDDDGPVVGAAKRAAMNREFARLVGLTDHELVTRGRPSSDPVQPQTPA